MLLRAHRRLAHFAATVPGSTLLVWLGAAGLVLAALSPWLSLPLTGRIPGLGFALWGSILLPGLPARGLHAASWGVLCLGLALLAALVEWRGARPRMTFLAGTAAALLWPLFLGSLAFRHPDLLERALAEARERSRIGRFSEQYLEGNAAALAGGPASPRLQGITDRWLTALDRTSFSAVGMGSELAALAGALLAAGAVGRSPAGSRRRLARDALALAALALAVTAWMAARPLAARVIALGAESDRTQGFLGRAVSGYERARRIDPFLSRSIPFAHRMGAALSRLGRLDRAETHLYLGDLAESGGDLRGALREYRYSLEIDPAHAPAAEKAAEALGELGLERFKDGLPNPAIDLWREAASLDAARLDLRFFLAQALFMLGAGETAAAVSEDQHLLGRVRDKLIRADVYVHLGDCYQRDRDLVRAREMYRRSLGSFHLVKRVLNFNAMTGLQGM